jgi:hypothetical protein
MKVKLLDPDKYRWDSIKETYTHYARHSLYCDSGVCDVLLIEDKPIIVWVAQEKHEFPTLDDAQLWAETKWLLQ